jgi:hypothetical protein
MRFDTMKKLVLAAVALSLLSGCASMKHLTGQTNDTVLPGQREEILPPDQQQARDPSITGQPDTAANQPITQAPVNGAQPTMPGAPKASAPLSMSKTASTADCDPKVDLCPEPMAPEPLPPPSPVKVAGAKTTAGATATAGKAIDPKTGLPVTSQKGVKKKKVAKKKKPVTAATPAVAAAPTESGAPVLVDPNAPPPVPAPPQPQGQ